MSVKAAIRTYGIQIALVLLVFIIFLASAIGILELNIISGIKISLTSHAKDGLILSEDIIKTGALPMYITIGLSLSVLLPMLDPIKSSLLTFVAMLIPLCVHYFTHIPSSLLPLEYTLLTILMLYLVNIMISYFIEVHDKQKILKTIGHYLPPQIVDKIGRGEETFTLDGEARQLTVMFCDIENFTAVAEEMDPKQVANLLNEYFTALTKVLYKHNATIDKFIGDSIMAFWGAPLKQENHAQLSIYAALEMENEINNLSVNFSERGIPGIKAGFGINSGMMAVGNMGSAYRIAYTVIGDAVNVASRLEKLTRDYRVPIIVNESTMSKSDDILFRELDNVTLRGKRSELRIFQPLGLKSKADKNLGGQLEKHSLALNYYYKGQMDHARKIFSELYQENPNDNYYSVMLEKTNLS